MRCGVGRVRWDADHPRSPPGCSGDNHGEEGGTRAGSPEQADAYESLAHDLRVHLGLECLRLVRVRRQLVWSGGGGMGDGTGAR